VGTNAALNLTSAVFVPLLLLLLLPLIALC
jgi:hypothetical protein